MPTSYHQLQVNEGVKDSMEKAKLPGKASTAIPVPSSEFSDVFCKNSQVALSESLGKTIRNPLVNNVYNILYTKFSDKPRYQKVFRLFGVSLLICVFFIHGMCQAAKK